MAAPLISRDVLGSDPDDPSLAWRKGAASVAYASAVPKGKRLERTKHCTCHSINHRNCLVASQQCLNSRKRGAAEQNGVCSSLDASGKRGRGRLDKSSAISDEIHSISIDEMQRYHLAAQSDLRHSSLDRRARFATQRHDPE